MTLPKYTPKQLVKQHRIDVDHLGHFMYYDHVRSRWKHHGYYCLHCDKVFSKEIRARNHITSCKIFNRTKVYFVDTYEIILDKFGKPWNPIV